MLAYARRGVRLLALSAVITASLAAAPAAARAADPAPSGTALGKAPADVEYYRSMLRLGETIETIGKSRAWHEVWNEPRVQELWKTALASYQDEEGEWAPVRKFLADPANAELPALAADAVSQEIFVYAGSGTGDLVVLMQEAVGAARYGPAAERLFGEQGDPSTAQARAALQALAENPERIRTPELVIGFRVSDPAKVAAQLKRLDPVLADALKGSKVAGRSKRVKVGGDEFLTLNLDGSLVPWDDLPIAALEEEKGEFDPLLKRLKALKLTVAVGVRQGYLLVAVGETADHLTKFGGPGPKLADVPEMKPLATFAGKPVTAVSFASPKLLGATATTPEDVEGIAQVVKAALRSTGLTDDELKPIDKDIDALAGSCARGLVKPGARVSVSFRTPRGWETFDYDYTAPGPGEPRPLTLLDHLGGTPLLAAVWRSGTTVEDYRAFAKWVATFAGHAEAVVKALAPDAAETVDTVRKEFTPLVKELSDITEKLWLPALADGQEAVVVDAKWASRRWHPAVEADRELPLPEPGVVLGVSDAAKLEQALGRYRTVANKMIAKARELAPPDTFPEFEIPKPQVERANGRTFAHYPIPEGWELDRQFRPTGGLTAKVAVLALSRDHAERLLTPTPLTTGLAPFADTKRPLESAFYWNWAGMVDAAGPWVGYLMSRAELDDQAEAERIGAKVMQLVKVFRRYGSVTYREGGVTVTHSEAVFRDTDPVVGK